MSKSQRLGPLTRPPASLPGAAELATAANEMRDRYQAFIAAPSDETWLASLSAVDHYLELLTNALAAAGSATVFTELRRGRDLLADASTALHAVESIDDLEAAATMLDNALTVLAAAWNERSARSEAYVRMQTSKPTSKATGTGRRHRR